MITRFLLLTRFLFKDAVREDELPRPGAGTLVGPGGPCGFTSGEFTHGIRRQCLRSPSVSVEAQVTWDEPHDASGPPQNHLQGIQRGKALSREQTRGRDVVSDDVQRDASAREGGGKSCFDTTQGTRGRPFYPPGASHPS